MMELKKEQTQIIGEACMCAKQRKGASSTEARLDQNAREWGIRTLDEGAGRKVRDQSLKLEMIDSPRSAQRSRFDIEGLTGSAIGPVSCRPEDAREWGIRTLEERS
jgi:hypothetical protein